MADAMIEVISAVAPNIVLLMIIFVPLVVIGAVAFLFMVSAFSAYAVVEYGYESKNDIRTFKVKYSKDRSFLIGAGIPGMDQKPGFPIPLVGKPVRMKGKPTYRFYSPEPGIFVPVNLALDRTVQVRTGEKNEAGQDILREMQIGDLIPKIGFEARQAFGESYSEADKLFADRNKIMGILATWAPIIIFVVLMLVVIVMLGNLVSNLSAGISVQCVTEAANTAAAAANATAPFFRV